MEEGEYNPQQGGGGAAGVRIFLSSRGGVGVALWIGDLGGHPPHGKGPGGVPVPGGVNAGGVAPVANN